MKTEQVLLYGGGAFLLYKLFIAPKSTVIPTQSAPIYTGQPVTTTSSNTGSLLALGTGLAATIANLLNPKTATTAAPTNTGSSPDLSNEISDVFGSGFANPVAVTTNSPANNFGLPTSFDSGSLDDYED